jgi:DUF4097 and DUF4098 domain-containing protein YvlB
MTMELRESATGLDLIDVRARAGSLMVEGVEGLTEIRVDATLCASSTERMEGLDVTLNRSGSGVVLETVFPDRNRSWRNGYARIDVVVTVPMGLDARVVDGSGEATITGVGALAVEDGSGQLSIRSIGGDLSVEDGSGEVDVVDVVGSVRLEDGSGEIFMSGIEGNVTLHDGSGGVRIEDVEGDVEVLGKGSGTIDVSDVRGGLRVEGTRRERVRYEGVRGAVDLPPARRRGRGGN